MPPTPENSAAAKTLQQLQALGVRDAFGYLGSLKDILDKIMVTSAPGNSPAVNFTLNDGIKYLNTDFLESALLTDQRLIVVGNGASAAIAIHTLADFANAGGLKTIDLFSPALLTCMANDYGYENVFAKPIEILANGDILFAVSSSGQSPNIIKACQAALAKKCQVFTFSGFSQDNPLRKLGRLNFYVPSTHYGFVEITHQIILHCILDLFIRNNVNEEGMDL